MRIQWFGEPWPSAERRAPICADDSNKIATPVNTNCLECKKPIEEKHRGVVTGCSPGIWGHWILDRDGARVPVCSYHLVCWLKEVVGGELSAKILARMEYRSFDDPGVKKITEAQDVQPGRGWREES